MPEATPAQALGDDPRERFQFTLVTAHHPETLDPCFVGKVIGQSPDAPERLEKSAKTGQRLSRGERVFLPDPVAGDATAAAEELARHLPTGRYQFLLSGTFWTTPDLEFELGVAKSERPEDGIFARTSRHFRYTTAPAAYLVDIDTEDPGDQLATLLELVPGLGGKAMVSIPSSSGGVLRPDGSPHPGSGCAAHAYFFLEHGDEAEAATRAILDALWLRGKAQFEVGKGGQLLERSIIDKAVIAPSMPRFESDPELHDGLRQVQRKPSVVPGQLLRMADIELAPEDLARVAKLKAEDRKRKARDRKSAVKRAISEITRQQEGLGVSDPGRFASAFVLTRSLPPEFVLEAHDGDRFTVAEAHGDRERFDGKYVKHPFVLDHPNGNAVIGFDEAGMDLWVFNGGGFKVRCLARTPSAPVMAALDDIRDLAPADRAGLAGIIAAVERNADDPDDVRLFIAAVEEAGLPLPPARKRSMIRLAAGRCMRWRYEMADDGLYHRDPLLGTRTWLCDRFEVVFECEAPGGGSATLVLRITDGSGATREIVLPKATLSDTNDAIKALLAHNVKVDVTREGREHVRNYLATVPVLERATVVDRQGWVDASHTSYVFADGEIVQAQGAGRVVYRGRAGSRRISGTLEGWTTGVAATAVGNSRLVLALCCGLAGFCLALIGGETRIVHLHGSSGRGKTISAGAGASCSGIGKATWLTTSNGLEGIALECNDGVLWLDEAGEADPKTVYEAAYKISNERSKIRMTADGMVREVKRWLELVISTGEHSFTDTLARAGKEPNAGQLVRFVDVPADTGVGYGAFEDIHGHTSSEAFAKALAISSAEHCGHAAPALLRAIVADPVRAAGELTRLRDEWLVQHRPEGCDPQVSRVATTFAVLAAVGEYAAGAGVLPWPRGEATAGIASCFDAWLSERRSPHLSQEIAEGITSVRDFLLSQGNRFESPRAAINGTPCVPDLAGLREVIDPDDKSGEAKFYVFQGAWEREVLRGKKWREVTKFMAGQGWLDHNTGRLTTIKRIRGSVARCYAVEPQFFAGVESVLDPASRKTAAKPDTVVEPIVGAATVANAGDRDGAPERCEDTGTVVPLRDETTQERLRRLTARRTGL